MLRSCSVFFLIAGLQVVISQSPPADEEDDGGPKGPYVANDPRQGPFFEPYQEMIPRHCWGPPANVNPYECCPMPKVFSDEEMATCGIEKPNLDKPPPSPEKFANYRSCCVFPPFFTREVAKECGAGLELLFVDEKNNVTGFRRKAFNDCDHWMCVLDKYSLLTRYGDLDDEKYYAHLDLWVGLNPMFADAMMEAKVHCKQNVRFYLPLKPCEFFHLHGCIRNFLEIDCPVTIPTKECEEVKAYYKECREYYHKK